MTNLYTKIFLPGDLVINNKATGLVLEGPTLFKTYKILKNTGDIVWVSHTCLEDVRIFGWGPNIS
jgi:hypothetical protein